MEYISTISAGNIKIIVEYEIKKHTVGDKRFAICCTFY